MSETTTQRTARLLSMSNAQLIMHCQDITKQRDDLMAALSFYADPIRYLGANQRNDSNDAFTPNGFPYIVDVTRDGGSVAKAAIANVKGDV